MQFQSLVHEARTRAKKSILAKLCVIFVRDPCSLLAIFDIATSLGTVLKHEVAEYVCYYSRAKFEQLHQLCLIYI